MSDPVEPPPDDRPFQFSEPFDPAEGFILDRPGGAEYLESLAAGKITLTGYLT